LELVESEYQKMAAMASVTGVLLFVVEEEDERAYARFGCGGSADQLDGPRAGTTKEKRRKSE
jgi:hypothetical protein